MTRIVFFQGRANYDVFPHWIKAIRHELELRSFVTSVVDLTDLQQVQQNLNAAFDPPAACYIGFNAQGAEFEAPPFSAFSRVGRPFLGLCVDHPSAHHDRLIQGNPHLFFSFIDHSHVAFAKAVYPEGSYAFLPHAASPAQGVYSQKPYDLAFLGSFQHPQERQKKWQTYPDYLQRTLKECLALLCEGGDYLQLLDRLFTTKQISPSTALLQQPHAILTEVDQYTREEKRLTILHALDAAGISVHLFGAGWESGTWRNHIVHGPITYAAALEIMAQTKCLLDINPNFPAALHERFLSGILNGAVVLTDKATTCDAEFKPGQTHVTYQPTVIEELIEQIPRLLTDETFAHKLVETGRTLVQAKHTWNVRSQQLLDIIQLLQSLSLS